MGGDALICHTAKEWRTLGYWIKKGEKHSHRRKGECVFTERQVERRMRKSYCLNLDDDPYWDDPSSNIDDPFAGEWGS